MWQVAQTSPVGTSCVGVGQLCELGKQPSRWLPAGSVIGVHEFPEPHSELSLQGGAQKPPAARITHCSPVCGQSAALLHSAQMSPVGTELWVPVVPPVLLEVALVVEETVLPVAPLLELVLDVEVLLLVVPVLEVVLAVLAVVPVTHRTGWL